MSKVLCDTNFFIHLLKADDHLFENAKGYFKNFVEKHEIFMSTIAIAEYCVKGNFNLLPLKNIKIIPFNLNHAKKAGKFASVAHNARRDGNLDIDKREIVLNDVKMFAQAECENFDYYITADSNSRKIYDFIKPQFKFIDLHTPYSDFFSIFDFPNDDDDDDDLF